MSNTNTAIKQFGMASSNCIICCKKTVASSDCASGGSRKSLVHRFLTLVDNHFGYHRQECVTGALKIKKSSTTQGPPDTDDDQTDDLLACCAECAKLVERFCDLHQEIKCLEVHLLSKLQTEPESTSSKFQKRVTRKSMIRTEEESLFTGEPPFEPGTAGEIRKDLRRKFSQFNLTPKIILERVDAPIIISNQKQENNGDEAGLQLEADDEDAKGIFVMDTDVEVKMEINDDDDDDHYHRSDELERGDPSLRFLGDHGFGNFWDLFTTSTADTNDDASVTENVDSDVDINSEDDDDTFSNTATEESAMEQEPGEVRITDGDEDDNTTQDRHGKRIHRCQVCRKRFSTRKYLMSHKKEYHAPELSYSSEESEYNPESDETEDEDDDDDEDEDEEFSTQRHRQMRSGRRANETASAEKLAQEWLPLQVLENGPTLEEFISKPVQEMLTYCCDVDTCKSEAVGFMSEGELEKHSKLHGKFKCNFCSVQETYAPRLALHEATCSFSKMNESTKDSSIKRYKRQKCPRCPLKFFKFSKVEYLAHHVEVHQGFDMPIILFCPLCRCPFYRRSKMKLSRETVIRHMLKAHDISDVEPSQVHTCLRCQPPVFFRKPGYLRAHISHSHAARNRKKNLDCEEPECAGRKFTSLENHRRRCHADNPKYFPFACEHLECQVRCSTEKGLQAHKARHHSAPITFSCTDCDKTFHFKYKLEIHKFSHSEDSQPNDKYVFKCPSCNDISGKYAVFWNHMKRSHGMVLDPSNFDRGVLIRWKRGDKMKTRPDETHSDFDESVDNISSKDLEDTDNTGKTSGCDKKRPKKKRSSERDSCQQKKMKSSETEKED